MKVSEIHSQGTVHIPTTCNLQEAAIQMREQHVGALIATEGGTANRIAGIVTDRDIVLQAVTVGASPNEILVADVMTRRVMSIDVDADIADAMQTMSSHGVRRLAVTNGDQDIVGVLSLDDVIDALARELSLLSSIIRSEQHRECFGSVQSPIHL